MSRFKQPIALSIQKYQIWFIGKIIIKLSSIKCKLKIKFQSSAVETDLQNPILPDEPVDLGATYFIKTGDIDQITNGHFNGAIENVTIVNTSLTIEEQQKLYGCQIAFEEPNSLIDHISEVGKSEIFFKVENSVIEPEISNSSTLAANDKKLFKCKVCSSSFSDLDNLKEHISIHKKDLICEVCSKVFDDVETYRKHKNLHVKKPYTCNVCHAIFFKMINYKNHLKSHEEQNPDAPAIVYKCKICETYCKTKKSLNRHLLLHGEKKYTCTVCKKWFFKPGTLKKHAEKHGHSLLDNVLDTNDLYDSDPESDEQSEENEKTLGQYKCQNCDKVLASKKGLRRHVAMHKPKPEPAICDICDKVCASRARLSLHQKTHDKPKDKVPREYLCHICSKVYPSNSSLTYHMRTHSGIKPHVCKICNSGFTTTTSLQNHIRIHTGDKPFVCHVCSAAFAVSSAFKRHLTRHTGEANYHCTTCGKSFKRLSTLKEHTYTHSGEKPYVCKRCGAAYSHSGSLFAHLKRCKLQQAQDSLLKSESLTVIDEIT